MRDSHAEAVRIWPFTGTSSHGGCHWGATVPAACQALCRARGVIPLARSTLALGPAL